MNQYWYTWTGTTTANVCSKKSGSRFLLLETMEKRMVTFMANITRRHLICAVLPFVTALEADVAMATIRHQHVPSRNVSFLEHAATGHEVKATTSAMLAFPRRLPRQRRRIRRCRSKICSRQHRRLPTLGAPLSGGFPRVVPR